MEWLSPIIHSLVPRPSHAFQFFRVSEVLKNMGRPGYKANHLYHLLCLWRMIYSVLDRTVDPLFSTETVN